MRFFKKFFLYISRILSLHFSPVLNLSQKVLASWDGSKNLTVEPGDINAMIFVPFADNGTMTTLSYSKNSISGGVASNATRSIECLSQRGDLPLST